MAITAPRKVAFLPPPYTNRLLSLDKERKYTKKCGQFPLYLKEHTSLQRKKFKNINPANLPVNLLSTSSVISQGNLVKFLFIKTSNASFLFGEFFHNSYLFLQVRFNNCHPQLTLTAMASVFLWFFSSGSITSLSISLHDHWFRKLYNLLVTTCFILLSRIYFSDGGGNCKRSVHA